MFAVRLARRLGVAAGLVVLISVIADVWAGDIGVVRMALFGIAAGLSTLLISLVAFYLYARGHLRSLEGQLPAKRRDWLDWLLVSVAVCLIDSGLWSIDSSPHRGLVVIASFSAGMYTASMTPGLLGGSEV